MPREYGRDLVFHKEGLQPVPVLFVRSRLFRDASLFLLGIERVMDKDECMLLLRCCQDLLQPFELLAGDPFILSLDIGIEHNEQRVPPTKE